MTLPFSSEAQQDMAWNTLPALHVEEARFSLLMETPSFALSIVRS